MKTEPDIEYSITGGSGGRIIRGNCLSQADNIENGSVDLILTDPPYGTVKGIGDANGIQHGMSGKTGWDNALSPRDILGISERLLRKNGKLILFSQEPYTSELITSTTANLPFSYRMVWLKDHFANSLAAKEAPVNYFEDILLFTREYDNGLSHPLREYAKRVMTYIDLSIAEINRRLGHRGAEHFFYTNSSQFELAPKKRYSELIDEFDINEMDGFKQYDELEQINEQFKEKNPNIFNLPDGEKYKSNIFEYDKPQSDHHPTQKPVPLLEDLITTYTYEGDRVVDLTAGSGSTAVAAHRKGRECIAIEKDEGYHQTAVNRVSNIDASQVSTTGQSNLEAYTD